MVVRKVKAPKATSPAPLKFPDCIECAHKSCKWLEYYTVSGDEGELMYNVSLAKKLVAKSEHPLLEVPKERLDNMLAINVVLPEHVAHLDKVTDVNVPGIMAVYHDKFVFIDGSHRAMWKKLHNEPFYVQVLSNWESIMCLMDVKDIKRYERDKCLA